MISCDTNILLPALEASHPDHSQASRFLEAHTADEAFALCELVLVEVYTLLRNPTVCARPLSPSAAVRLIDNLRKNPSWAVLDYPGGLMDEIWKHAGRIAAYRRIFDIRLALTLRHHGVSELATANIKDFSGFGFARVWNPLID